MPRLFSLCLYLLSALGAFATPILSPEAFLGYSPGSRFSFHHRIVDYFEHVATNSDKVSLIPYGSTWEGRPLMIAVVTSPENHKILNLIQAANLARTGMAEKPTGKDPHIPIVWLSYNIHGDEASSSEAAMEVLYHLVERDTTHWLDSMVILIDPCLNPDGRDRYVQWQLETGAGSFDLSPQSAEHEEDWPGGRENHYLFDLNRDWCWQTQPESRQRAALYYQWMPQIHVDFHEMKSDNPTYFFPPASRPFHPAISQWQREFHQLIGKNHAAWFNRNHWLYFTREIYDLFYPSYGDTWPTFQGAMGFTYEQTGGDDAGRAVILPNGDTLTLADRIRKHFTTSISTLETAFRYRKKLITEFRTFFEKNQKQPYGIYKTYIIKTDSLPERVNQLLKILDQNKIRYGATTADAKTLKGFSYTENKEMSFPLTSGDIIISAYQPNSLLLQILFEPDPFLEDSLTYDLTAWALPYAYGVECYALENRIEPEISRQTTLKPPVSSAQTSDSEIYAWLVKWEDFHHAQFLAATLKEGLIPSRAWKPFRIDGESFSRGTLIYLLGQQGETGVQKLQKIAEETGVQLFPVSGGRVEEGSDLGSENVHSIRPLRVATIRGEGISSGSFGEIWYFFEQDLRFPITVFDTRYLEKVDLSGWDVLVLPSGNYGSFHKKILDFVSDGGTVIALEKSLDIFAKSYNNNPPTALTNSVDRGKRSLTRNFMSQETPARLFEERQRATISNSAPGSIFSVKTDPTHPLAFGMGDSFFMIKRNEIAYPLLEDTGWNVGIFPEDAEVGGFTGNNVKETMSNSMALGEEKYGKGRIIYFTESPVIRGFWYSGKLLLANAVFYQD
ncbi:MAG: M14 family metallopeptidase [Bacteroidia bacterium]|nr:M14 family metallopeptidase [Bacteroidia bacterium]